MNKKFIIIGLPILLIVLAAAVIGGVYLRQRQEISKWGNYIFELEDITDWKALDWNGEGSESEFLKTISLHQIEDPTYPADTRIWKINNKTGEKELFVESTRKKAGKPLTNVSFVALEDSSRFSNLSSGEIHRVGLKLYFDLYEWAGKIPANNQLWQLDLNTKQFRQLLINEFLGEENTGLGAWLTSWSPDGTKLISTQKEEQHQILRVLDIINDTSKVIATSLSGNKSFALEVSEWCRKGNVNWINNNTFKIRIYDNSKDYKYYGENCSSETDYIEEKVINVITEEEIEDKTVDWETYFNTAYSFSFNYPKKLDVRENPPYLSRGNGPLGSVFNVSFFDSSKSYTPEHPFEFYASVKKNDKQLQPMGWFVSQEFPPDLGGDKYRTINGIPAVDFASEGAGGRTIYFFLKTEVVVLVQGEMLHDSFDIVVSSLKSNELKN